MAARQMYPTPHEQLRELAIIARANGLPFDVFWDRAIRSGTKPVTWAWAVRDRPAGCVIWPRDTQDRNMNREIVESPEVREGWRRAYEDAEPTRADRALQKIAPGMEALERAAAEAAVAELQTAELMAELPVAV